MAMQGSLTDMDVATLIQHNCQDFKTAQLDVQHNGNTATLFFKGGNVVHASLNDIEGEEVVFRIINWSDGIFTLELDVDPPTVSIDRSWSGLLLEAAQRFDEASEEAEIVLDVKVPTAPPPPEKPVAESPRAARDRKLAAALEEFLVDASEIEGAAVVGTDGIIYGASIPNLPLNENTVGAVTAAIYGLSRRSISQLKRGNFAQTFIQGKDGNIITAGLDDQTLFVGLTSQPINLGMAFAEVREVVSHLRTLL